MSDEHDNAHSSIDEKISHKDLITVHTSMLEGLSQLADYFGFPKVMGQLYGVLFMSGEPLSLDDMMDTLSISKASVSMNMRTLEHMGMVRQVWVRGKGGRRKYYEAETDFLQIISNILNGREIRDIDRALTVMNENIERLNRSMTDMNDAEAHLAEVYIERITHMQMMFKFAQTLITSILARMGDVNLNSVSDIEIR